MPQNRPIRALKKKLNLKLRPLYARLQLTTIIQKVKKVRCVKQVKIKKNPLLTTQTQGTSLQW